MSPWRGTGAASGHGRDIFGQMLGACVPAACRKRRAICLGAISKNCVTGLLSSPLPKAVTFPLSVGLRKVQEYSGAKPGRV